LASAADESVAGVSRAARRAVESWLINFIENSYARARFRCGARGRRGGGLMLPTTAGPEGHPRHPQRHCDASAGCFHRAINRGIGIDIQAGATLTQFR
jgi:hypothetical protein